MPCNLRVSVLTLALVSSGVLAQSGVTVSEFGPTSIRVDQPISILVTGSGFQSGDIVAFSPPCGGFYSFTTTSYGSTQLLTTVPAYGLAFGTYTIGIVRTPGSFAATGGILTVRNTVPILLSVTPLTVPAGTPNPVSFTVSGFAFAGVNPCGLFASNIRFICPPGGIVSSASVGLNGSGSVWTVQFPPECFAFPGEGRIEIVNFPPGGGVAFAPITITCASLSLYVGQPQGLRSLDIRNTCGTPGAFYVTAISYAPENLSAPSQGWWGGLHIDLLTLSEQITSFLPPFSGWLDSSGSSHFALPEGSLPPSYLGTIHLVTRTFGPGNFNLLATTPVKSKTLL